jgi:hypothetical protein
VKPKNIEETSRVNGTMKSQEVAINPGESQMIMSDHQLEGTVEDVMGWLEWYFEVQMMATRTLRQPPTKANKKHVPRSPRKQPITTIVLSHILDGVQVKPDLLGHINKIK